MNGVSYANVVWSWARKKSGKRLPQAAWETRGGGSRGILLGESQGLCLQRLPGGGVFRLGLKLSGYVPMVQRGPPSKLNNSG